MGLRTFSTEASLANGLVALDSNRMILLVLRSRDRRWSGWSSLHQAGKRDSLRDLLAAKSLRATPAA
ncbi:hypothetical protein CEXT_585271 [Caerostris extrusa]|uniref:Uncharacterized protein n=1 Tax=Caerostris extrusa TaxID=172846 RepID=A0AAV4RKZ7_CAEEX|nr:hypothetical protein CEXT_585271 [Caerostris extrusa]